MVLYKISDQKVSRLSVVNINKEKDIQKLFEQNLSIILDIDFLDTEYSTSFGGRIDTLGIDKNGSPVIIEYKKTQNENVINQGLSYLKWLLDHKADFEVLCKKKNITISIDWTTPRVICIAESYNKFDLDTVEILPLKIELLKYRLFEDNLLSVDFESQKPVKISTSKIFNNSKTKTEQKKELQKEYSVDKHLTIYTNNIKQLYFKLKEVILQIDSNIVEEAKAKYIAYKLTTNIVDVVLQKNAIKIFLNIPSGKLMDPYSLARDLRKPKAIGHWGNGDYEIILKDQRQLNSVMELIHQSYDYNR